MDVVHLKSVLLLVLLLCCGFMKAEEAEIVMETNFDTTVVLEKDVAKKLERWRDYKFGLFMHWGLYSVEGIVESWSLCGEDVDWTRRGMDDYNEYVKWYENLRTRFNPVEFNPDRWAEAAAEAGMKYVIFTTKHHDGFCMFDTKETDYKVTSKDCPFSQNKRSDITKEIFNSFRKKDFMIGAYYSKPDWHSDYYWWPYFPAGDRHVNYDPARHPERWGKYKDFIYEQINELTTDYGSVDILWLDGAWVRPIDNMNDHIKDWAKKKNYDQDIDMDRIVNMARKNQPGLIVVDRWVPGKYENYATPENKVPPVPYPFPWESCITITPGWGYSPQQPYKTVNQLVHLLVDIVSKGGNLLLNVAPSPLGDWVYEAYERLEGVGEWMAVNQSAIYETRPVHPYKEGNICYTKAKDKNRVNLIYLAEENEEVPSEIELKKFPFKDVKSVSLLGADLNMKWVQNGTQLKINVPKEAREKLTVKHAWVFTVNYQ